MSIFDFFKKEKVPPEEPTISHVDSKTEENIIDRNLFVKDNVDTNNDFPESGSSSWRRIFSLLRKDYELEGYNDALSTADNKYKNDNTEILKLNLGIDLEEAEIEINEFLKELDFHITSRKKANLIDLVEELESKKQVYKERLDKLSQLKNDIKNNSGLPQRIILAYNRGFNKGLAALSIARIINKNI